MKKYLLSCLLTLLSLALPAADITISGYISDEETGETLINATVFDSISGKGAVSNLYGFYTLTLPEGQVHLIYSYLGYKPQRFVFRADNNRQLTVRLQSGAELEEVVVSGRQHKEFGVLGTQMSAVEIPVAQIKNVPSLLGENDVIKALQLLPGVQSGSEGSAGLYVRGGGPDENLLLLDGVPVYNVNHMFGFFSVFNADAIKNVTLYKGNFPARFGGRLSSVVDIRMNDGNDKSYHGNVSVGLISSKFNFEGPIVREKTSFNLSFRRTYADLLLQPILQATRRGMDELDKLSAGYYFYDFNVKINHKFSDRDRLYLSFYSGDDAIYAKVRNKYTESKTYKSTSAIGLDWAWGNLIAALRWNHIINSKMFLNTTASYTRYRFDMSIGLKDENWEYQPPSYLATDIMMGYRSGIEDYTIKADLDYTPNPGHTVKLGANYTYHTFKPGVTVAKFRMDDDSVHQNLLDTVFGDSFVYAHETMLYAEDNIDLGRYVKANLGLHYSTFFVQRQFYHSLQPRLGLRFLFSDNFSFKAGYAMMNQYIHLLSNSDISLPTDLWVPVTKRITPMNSHQVSAGLFYNLKNLVDLSVEGYYKSMHNILEYKDGASFMGSTTGWEDKVSMGRGWSYGLEFLAQKSYGRYTGWIGYTWAKSERLFDRPGQELNNGKVFPAKYDRRHDLSITASYKLNDRIDFAASWVYSSGNCATLALQNYEGSPVPDSYQYYFSSLPYIESRNNYRFESYQRLDIGVNFRKKLKRGTRTWNISAYNAYNRNNPFFVYPSHSERYDPVSRQYVTKRALKQVSIFPLIPSISYSYSF